MIPSVSADTAKPKSRLVPGSVRTNPGNISLVNLAELRETAETEGFSDYSQKIRTALFWCRAGLDAYASIPITGKEAFPLIAAALDTGKTSLHRLNLDSPRYSSLLHREILQKRLSATDIGLKFMKRDV